MINFRHSNSTFYKFTTEIIEKVSYDAHKVDILNDYERSFQEALDDKQNRISGVNVGEEIAKSMILRNIHEATTSLVKTIDGMFSELLDAI